MREEIGDPGCTLWRYWSSLPRQGFVPFRRDFDPGAIRGILPIICILNHVGPGDWRIRLMGTGVVERARVDFTGRNFLDLMPEEQRAAEDWRLREMTSRPCGAFGVRRSRRASGIEYFVRTVAFPLRADDGEARLLISSNEELRAGGHPVDSRVQIFNPVSRAYIDIGAGVPVDIAERSSEAAQAFPGPEASAIKTPTTR